jgi:hypothetical protein
VSLPPRLPRSGSVEDGCLVWPAVSAVRIVTCLVVLALGTGCGGHGELDAGALSQQAKALQSVAAEGALLADDAASGKSTRVYSGEHSAELRGAAAQIAASLEATTTPGLDPKQSRSGSRDTDVVLGRICDAPERGRAVSGLAVSVGGRGAWPVAYVSVKKGPCRRARHPVGDWRVRRHRRSRVHAGWSDFCFQLLWVVVVGVVGIIVYWRRAAAFRSRSGRCSTSSAREPGRCWTDDARRIQS